MKKVVIAISICALAADLMMLGTRLCGAPLAMLLAPLAGLLGAIHTTNSGHGWWGLVLLLLIVLAVVGSIFGIIILLTCFLVYGDCQQPSPTENLEALVAFIGSVVVPPKAALAATTLIARSASASTATPAEEASAVTAGGTAVQAEGQTEPPAGAL